MKPSELLGARVRELRALNGGWSQRDLADRLQGHSVRLHHSAVAKVETGARRVDLDELLALAYVLNVAPVHLFVPPVGGEDETVHVEIVDGVRVAPSTLRRWIRGLFPIGQDPRRFYGNVPWGEWDTVTGDVGRDLRNAFEHLLTVVTEAGTPDGESQAINALMEAERAILRMRHKLGVPENYPLGGVETPGQDS